MKNTKTLITVALCFMLVMAIGAPAYASGISIHIDGVPATFTESATIIEGRTLVPLRAIFNELGVSIIWDNDTQTVTAEKDGVTVVMQIGNSVFTRNGEQITLDVPPQIIEGRTFVPARAVGESFGAKVGWERNTQTITISTGANGANSSNTNNPALYIEDANSIFANERSVRSLEWLDLENVEKIGGKRTFQFPAPYQHRVVTWYVLNVPGFSIEGLPATVVGNIFDSELGDILLVTNTGMPGSELLDGVFVYIDLGPYSSDDPLLRDYFIVKVE